MRKITSESIRAFENDFTFSKSNTKVRVYNDKTELSIFGNVIAIKNRKTGNISITNCGWRSNTTKERLNAIEGVSISQRKGVWYLNDKKWDGELISINGEEKKEANKSLDFMKAFLVMGDITDTTKDLKSKVDYKQRIVFATMKAQIPGWVQPFDWNDLTNEVKMERLVKIQEMA